MKFRLNGGPLDGQIIELTDHMDGKFIKVSLRFDDKAYLYICPSDDDFDSRDLFLSLEPAVRSTADMDAVDNFWKDGSYWKQKQAKEEMLKRKRLKQLSTMSKEKWNPNSTPTVSITHPSEVNWANEPREFFRNK